MDHPLRAPRVPLFWRIFSVNALLLVVAALLLALTPVTIHANLALVEAVEIVVGLLVMLAANLLLLRVTFRPLRRLVGRMATVDPLRPGQRLPVGAARDEISQLLRAFNEMLERLENERRESGRRVLAAQEGERLRISRGLHDEVGQVLTGVLLQLRSLEELVPDERRKEVEETQQALRQALEEVRRIARELRPELLEHLGLVSALAELAGQFARRTGIVVERRFARDLPPLAPDAELALYRIAQESLTNVARHAGATRVELALEAIGDRVALRVADDGRGFASGAVVEGHGGLRGMRERAVLVGGTLAIRPGRSGGAEVRFELPAGSRTPVTA